MDKVYFYRRAFILAAVLFVVDWGAKYTARSFFHDIVYNHSPVSLSVIVLALIVVLAMPMLATGAPSSTAAGLLLAGALGNSLESNLLGAVTDFIPAPGIPMIDGYYYNLADSFLMLGALTAGFVAARYYRNEIFQPVNQ